MKLRSPAAARNVAPIVDVLADWLPGSGRALEVASGSGEHAVAFAQAFPRLLWQPTDANPAALASINTWRVEERPSNLLPPLHLDVTQPDWPVQATDALVAVNLVHISPWEAALGLLAGAERLLPPAAPLIVYGPWLEDGKPTAPSNLLFDADLRRRDPRWGLRRVAEFTAAAKARGFASAARRAMPANNLMLLFTRER